MSADAERIVSLLPGATEWVCKLGLADRLVGVSHECDFPVDVNSLPRVTRSHIDIHQTSTEIDHAVRTHSESKTPLYDLDADQITQLNPDLILTQSLCNVCAVSERDVLASVASLPTECQVLDLRAQTFRQVIDDATAIVAATGNPRVSRDAIESLLDRINIVRHKKRGERPKVMLIEWADPLFCSGHWTPELIHWAGGYDPIGRSGEPSRTISSEELTSADPEILLVACCGLDEARSRAEISILEQIDGWFDIRAVRSEQVHCFDGSAYFNRPGPRLVQRFGNGRSAS